MLRLNFSKLGKLTFIIIALLLLLIIALKLINNVQNVCLEPKVITPTTRDDLVLIEGGEFIFGSKVGYPQESPATKQNVESFFISMREVTNADFVEFVEQTGYKTLSERGVQLNEKNPVIKGSATFTQSTNDVNKWSFSETANWKNPFGYNTQPTNWLDLPVIHITYEDALAYANWLGRSLPSEIQWEFAAKQAKVNDAALNNAQPNANSANTWQGLFPSLNTNKDGYADIAPVGCFPADKLGLYDMIGNVWEWTLSDYYPSHDYQAKTSLGGFDPNQPGVKVKVIKGGSFLCSKNACQRYRASSRHPQDITLGTNHIGFRTVLNINNTLLSAKDEQVKSCHAPTSTSIRKQFDIATITK